ncbi:GNAT family N-acetyltransferase [Comamonas terrigena]|uniref:GNAT family N-acetyltransferase n=1 Tax=Comamonas terrigena TaxID=32013 RepID=UPI001B683E76|nr:GNAT family N-acetyltransferase [Comamonas terrigena]MBP7352586.1 GNAT family N-acetyltransferase [Comamonas sp.]MDH1703055.1 GNAT family N-acetyltransferase [Comamonas terrigena]
MSENAVSGLVLRQATPADLPRLIAIENACFTPQEAATPAAFAQRLQCIPDSFWVAVLEGRVVGLVNGPVVNERYIRDGLFRELGANPATGGHQTVLGLAVDPACRQLGLGRRLLAQLEAVARAAQRETVTLTCLQDRVPFYEALGYANEGPSASAHAGAQWFNMVKPLA